MGPGDSAVQSPGSSCLPGGSQVHLTRPVSSETRTLLFTQLQEPWALFVGLTVGWGLWRGFGNENTGGMSDRQPLTMSKEDQAREIRQCPDRCCSKLAGTVLCLRRATLQPAEVQVER